MNREYGVDFVLLAGYLKLIPAELVKAFPKRILNIHPALLPAFGGKGLYGMRVHKAVLASGARYVFQCYDGLCISFYLVSYGFLRTLGIQVQPFTLWMKSMTRGGYLLKVLSVWLLMIHQRSWLKGFLMRYPLLR